MAIETVPDRRDARILFLPLLAGLFAPWAAWAMAGEVGLSALATVSFAMGCAYLVCVHWLGDREAEIRRRLGRRYEPPPPQLAAAVCSGLAFSLLAPGLSVQALAATVGYPRVSGEIREYLSADIARSGARIALSPAAMPLGSSLVLLPDGTARLAVPRFGRPAVYAFPWRPEPKGVCLSGWCFTLDPANGRLRAGEPDGVEMGRVAAIGPSDPAAPDRTGTPWEVQHLFTDLPLLR